MGQPSLAKMAIGVTGASGLIGSALVPLLIDRGHQVIPLPRKKGAEILFSGANNSSAPFSLDAVVHLAGEPIASGRWTAAKKTRIYDSRIEGTQSLCHALAQRGRPPRVIVSASAVGYYGDRGNQLLDEQSSPGEGFLPHVVQDWEQAVQPAVQCGIRVVCLRFGMILSRHGGALAKMLRPFQFGLGGRLGNGRQYWSWIALDDALEAIYHVLASDHLAGPVNVVSPRAVTNAEFTATLGKILRRPDFATMPAWAVRIFFGQMGTELLLASTRVAPRRLIESGYAFRHGQLDGALRRLLIDDC